MCASKSVGLHFSDIVAHEIYRKYEYMILSSVRGSVTNNNGFWIR
jgi:hypothetical protein